MLSLDDVDDRSPSGIRGMLQVVWLMARDTSWQNSTDFGIDDLLSIRKATYRGDGSPWMLVYFREILVKKGKGSGKYRKCIFSDYVEGKA